MKKKEKKAPGSTRADKETKCCKIESVVTIDERGQMVLPKEIRDRAKIRAGDKLAVVSMEKDGDVCCIYLMKVTDLSDAVRDKLGPLLKEMA